MPPIRLYSFLFLTLCLFWAGCAAAPKRPVSPSNFSSVAVDKYLVDPVLTQRILALDAENLSPENVSSALSLCPAPRVLAFNGTAFNTMDSFARFLIEMGYPEAAVRGPGGALSRSGYENSGGLVREIEDIRQSEKLKPMLIGHSRGGALVMKVLHDLKGPSVSFASAIATGRLLRVFGQWDTLGLLRVVPDSVDEFAGYRLAGDWIGSDLGGSGEYTASGSAKVLNRKLSGAGHVGITDIETLARKPDTRAQIDAYSPAETVESAGDAKLILASDIWYHVKKHWCLELQRLAREN